jgi:hypothetical protein
MLLVMRGDIDEASVRARCQGLPPDGSSLAICYELPSGHDGLYDGLSAQRRLTSMLRNVCGRKAEEVAVFVVADREGERVEDYARAWGATEVGD